MSPRTHEANEAIRDERKATILDTALGVFVERGFEGTRIQDIADRCGLSYGLVYRYFPSKETIFSTLAESALDAAESLIKTLPRESPPEAFGAFIGFAISGPSPHYFSIIIEALTNRGVAPELATGARERIKRIMAGIAAGGGFADPGEAAAWAESILAILLGASIMKICGVSNGDFASQAAAVLSAPKKE